MAVKNFVFRENWIGNKVAGMKTTFVAIFDPIWTHILASKTQIRNFLNSILVFNRVPVKASSFVIDKLFLSFDKSGFLTSKQKLRITLTKMGSHYKHIRKWWNIFKKLTGTLFNWLES